MVDKLFDDAVELSIKSRQEIDLESANSLMCNNILASSSIPFITSMVIQMKHVCVIAIIFFSC